MRLLEYEAKNLLPSYGITVPNGVTISVDDATFHPISYPVVVKSQVPVGGRGKLGGVKLVQNRLELEGAVNSISHLGIGGYTPRTILVEDALDIDHEFYVALVVNRSRGTIDLVAHRDGGVDIESQTDFLSKPIDHNIDSLGESLAELYGLEDKSFLLTELVEKLYRCFMENDATLLEINPLILTKDGELIAGDCKITLDDDAAFRHPDWDFEDNPANANFVSLDHDGAVATIANGAGLAMATVDAVKSAGLTPANFLDIGGGATVDGIIKSFASIMEFPNINAIIINIFGGIVRCDDVARAIIEARQQFEGLPKLYIRLSGTNSQEAAKLLENEHLVLYPDLAACVKGVLHG